MKKVYQVVWKEGGKEKSEPYGEFMQAQGRARELSATNAPVHITGPVRYVYATYKDGVQTATEGMVIHQGQTL